MLDGSKSVDPDYKDSDLDTLLSPLTWVAWKMLTLLYFENLIQETFYEKIPALACHTFSVMNGMFATCAQGATRGMRLFCCQPYVPLLFACPWSPHTVQAREKNSTRLGCFFFCLFKDNPAPFWRRVATRWEWIYLAQGIGNVVFYLFYWYSDDDWTNVWPLPKFRESTWSGISLKLKIAPQATKLWCYVFYWVSEKNILLYCLV